MHYGTNLSNSLCRAFPVLISFKRQRSYFDKIYRKLIGKNTLDRFFIRIFALFGYKYLVCAIVISMQDSYLLNGVTTKLCPEIARRYGVNPDSIERNIRTVISAIWYDRDQRSCAILWGAAISFSRATQSL